MAISSLKRKSSSGLQIFFGYLFITIFCFLIFLSLEKLILKFKFQIWKITLMILILTLNQCSKNEETIQWKLSNKYKIWFSVLEIISKRMNQRPLSKTNNDQGLSNLDPSTTAQQIPINWSMFRISSTDMNKKTIIRRK